MVRFGESPPSPRQASHDGRRGGSPPGSAARQLFPGGIGAGRAAENDAWRSVLGFLDARSEDGIHCALRVAEDGRLAAGPALVRLRAETSVAPARPTAASRPALDQRISKEGRMQVEALVEAARAEVIKTLAGASDARPEARAAHSGSA